jgi:hypothetical protein
MSLVQRRWLFLIVAAALFVGWIAHLGNLALATRHTIALSRAQLLVSTVDVIADVESSPTEPGRPRALVKVREVHWPASQREALVGKSIAVTNLALASGWTGTPGPYILPLIHDGPSYRVAPIPPSPGFSFESNTERIYPATPDTEAQLRAIGKPAG